MRALNLFVNNKHVACLQEEPAPLTGRPQYQLTYLPGVSSTDYLSLSLPVITDPYIVDDIPYALRQNFPEGERLLLLKKFEKIMDVSDNFGMLSIVGQHGIGRVSVSTTNVAPTGGIPTVNLTDATRSGRKLFNRLFNQYGLYHGVSGIQEKFLADSPAQEERSHIISNKYILKSFDPKYFPALAENEYWTTVAAKNSGLDCVDTCLSDDFSTLIVKRFDIMSDGTRLALDEMGALAGFCNDQKYLASYEVITDIIFKYCSSTEKDAVEFFKQMVFMVAVKNGDAHLKNFALLSGNGPICLAPAYDLVCTGTYIDEHSGEFENPAMPLENYRWEKRWWSKDELIVFGDHMLGLSLSQMEPIFEDVENGLQRTIKQMEIAPSSPDFDNKIKNKLIYIWSHPFSLEGYGEAKIKKFFPTMGTE